MNLLTVKVTLNEGAEDLSYTKKLEYGSLYEKMQSKYPGNVKESVKELVQEAALEAYNKIIKTIDERKMLLFQYDKEHENGIVTREVHTIKDINEFEDLLERVENGKI